MFAVSSLARCFVACLCCLPTERDIDFVKRLKASPIIFTEITYFQGYHLRQPNSEHAVAQWHKNYNRTAKVAA